MEFWLERNQGKAHWAVNDSFKAGSSRICAFTHKNYKIGLHTHEFIEINLVACGQGRHFMENQVMTVGAGDAFVIPPMVEHGYIDDGGLDVCHILVHPDYIAENLERFRWVDGYLTFFTLEPYFRQHGEFRHGLKLEEPALSEALTLFQKIEHEGREQQSSSGWAQECQMSLLIITLCRAHVASFGKDVALPGEHPHIKAVLAAINMVTKKKAVGVTLNDLARVAGLERSHFCRVFRKVTGMTAMEFVRHEMIKEAKHLLLENSLNIGEIAMELGYCDSAHFSKSFQAAVGCSPSALRHSRF